MNLPENFIAQMQHVLGADYSAFAESLEQETPTTIRLNPRKKATEETLFGGNLDKVKWNVDGRYLPQRPSFTLDPAFHAGAYYVQEASSMFVAEAAKQTLDFEKPLRIMDLCAAPGGKNYPFGFATQRKKFISSKRSYQKSSCSVEGKSRKMGFPELYCEQSRPRRNG